MIFVTFATFENDFTLYERAAVLTTDMNLQPEDSGHAFRCSRCADVSGRLRALHKTPSQGGTYTVLYCVECNSGEH